MKVIDLLVMSITNLWKRKLRTVLTVLGVVIGITSIVVMVALGNGLKTQMMESITQYSSLTQIDVSSGGGYSDDGTKKEDLYLSDTLIEQLKSMDHVVGVYPRLEVSAMAKSGQYCNWLQIIGMTKEEMESLNLKVGEGNIPTSTDKLQLFYGNHILEQFYIEKTYEYPYYDKGVMPSIDLMNDPIFIIFDTDAYYGGTNADGSPRQAKKYIIETAGILGGGQDEYTAHGYNVYANLDALKAQLKTAFKKKPIPGQPLTKKGKPYNEFFYSRLVVQADDMENVVELTNQINEMGYNAYNDAEWIESETQQLNTIQLVLGAIGAVSLLVAAIGITNTMMMSIYERTKEIGVMKVLGCDIRNIQALFLTEAGFIGLIGGIVGVGFSYGLGAIINYFVGMASPDMSGICNIPLWLPPLSILFAIIIGMVAGFLPSLRAMRLSPLAAIRNE